MTELIDRYYRVLDDGFVALKEVMGGDYSVERAARVSYGRGTRKVSDTRNLLRYLMQHKHTTPFEMAEMIFHVRTPCHVWRQWIRHRTANVNEYSMRYSVAIDSCDKTKPTEWRLQSKDNKQGSSGFVEQWPDNYTKYNPNEFSVPSPKDYEKAGEYLSAREFYFQEEARDLYEERLKFGVAREQARKDLPLSNYTEAYWKCDLHNLFHFLKLRLDPHAQKEIRDYANVVAAITKQCFPISFEAFYDYSLNGVSFSLPEMRVFHQIDGDIFLSTDKVAELCEHHGLSKREAVEFINKINHLQETTVNFDLETAETVNVGDKE